MTDTEYMNWFEEDFERLRHVLECWQYYEGAKTIRQAADHWMHIESVTKGTICPMCEADKQS